MMRLKDTIALKLMRLKDTIALKLMRLKKIPWCSKWVDL